MRFREHRRVYNRPSTNVERSIYIGVRHLATRWIAALEHRLCLAVCTLTVPADVARAARVAGIDPHDRYAHPRCLVGDERLQLKERPPAKTRSLIVPVPSPVADALELFERNPTSGVCSRRNELFRDDMILVAPEARLFGAEPLECAPDILRPSSGVFRSVGFVLEELAALGALTTYSLDGSTCLPLAVARRREVDDAKVDSNKVRRRDRRCVGQAHSHEQEPPAVLAQHEVGLSLARCEPLTLIGAHDHGYEHSAVEGQQARPVDALE